MIIKKYVSIFPFLFGFLYGQCIMMIYDYVIVGGGIAGLYSAFLLLQKNRNTKILLLERDTYLGGRIKTIRTNELTFEAGAGRFNQNHKLLLQLLRMLKLHDKKVKINGHIQFEPSHRNMSKTEKCNMHMYKHQSPFTMIDIVLRQMRKESKTELRKYTFLEYAQMVLNPEEIQFVLNSFGYYEQLVSMNACDAQKLLDEGMHSHNTFYTLKDGMDQIIYRLYDQIKLNIELKMKYELENIVYEKDIVHVHVKQRKTPFLAKACICALPQQSIKEIPFFKTHVSNIIESVGTKTLCRIYSKFKHEDIWFTHIKKTTTNNPNRYIIPIDVEKGLIMISYTDSKYAEYWKNMHRNALPSALVNNVHDAFGFEINRPIYTRRCFWKMGTSFWLKKTDSTKLHKQMLKPNPSIPVYVCGESFSQNQGWIEGALENVLEMMKLL